MLCRAIPTAIHSEYSCVMSFTVLITEMILSNSSLLYVFSFLKSSMTHSSSSGAAVSSSLTDFGESGGETQGLISSLDPELVKCVDVIR